MRRIRLTIFESGQENLPGPSRPAALLNLAEDFGGEPDLQGRVAILGRPVEFRPAGVASLVALFPSQVGLADKLNR